MLKLILVIVAVLAGLYVLLFLYLIPLALTLGALLHEDLFPKGDEAEKPPPSFSPRLDEAEFNRIAREAMAYSTQPHVTTISEALVMSYETALVRSTGDAFGRLLYVETQRRVGKTLHTVLCVYVDGAIAASASMETPVTQVRWDAYFAGLEDLRVGGLHVSYFDERGHRREARLRSQGRHHA
ncbi:MAG: hypothetical protein AAB554_01795 [Patescibacteria group bacterium]